MQKRLGVVILLAALLSGNWTPRISAADPLPVLATTSIIADVAQNVGGDFVQVTALIPVNSDPHSYYPTPRDLVLVSAAAIVLVNGIGLEENLLDVVTEYASVEPVVVSLGAPVLSILYPAEVGAADSPNESPSPYLGELGLDVTCEPAEINAEHGHAPCDPHIWTNPANVILWVANIAEAFAAADPDHAEIYAANAAAYTAELAALDAEIAALVEPLAVEKRVLVTSHTFLSYFAVAYNFEVVGSILPGVGASAEVSARDLIDLIDLVQERGIPVIFGEVSQNNELAETVAAEAGDTVTVILLYSGSLSEADGEAGNYLDYMRYNTLLIVAALGETNLP